MNSAVKTRRVRAVAAAITTKPIQPTQVASAVASQRPVYQFKDGDKVWFTRAEPGSNGPSVYRPDRRGKPSYGWATWKAPQVPLDATLVTEVPELVEKKLGDLEKMVRAADMVMVNMIGAH